jgi:hypothetical protein
VNRKIERNADKIHSLIHRSPPLVSTNEAASEVEEKKEVSYSNVISQLPTQSKKQIQAKSNRIRAITPVKFGNFSTNKEKLFDDDTHEDIWKETGLYY